MNFDRASPFQIELLPIHEPEKTYSVVHKTCRAVVETHGEELRIPFISRTEKGDFKAFMDELTERLDHTTVRLVAVGEHGDAYSEAMDKLSRDDTVKIEEAVNGFEKETLYEYEGSDGIEPVVTLVGEWEPNTE